MFHRSRKNVQLRRRGRPPPPAEQAFGAAAKEVDRAKEALLAAVPRGRGSGVPLAEALAAFEDSLRAAGDALEGWSPAAAGAPAGAERDACREAVEESLRRAEVLRLEATPDGYEELYVLLGHILDPLDVFAEAARSLREDR